MRITTTAAGTEAIAAARGLPDLITNLQSADPDLAAILTGKGLLQSKSPGVVLLTAVAAYASTKWGLGWDSDVCFALAAFALTIAGYVMRAVSSVPITGLFKAGTPAAPAPTAAATSAVAVVAESAGKTVPVIALLFLVGLGLAACTPELQTAQQAVQLYGIDKGMAIQAETANPAIAPAIDAALAQTDPIAAKVSAGLAVASEVSSLATAADALALQAAPLISVVPNPATK